FLIAFRYLWLIALPVTLLLVVLAHPIVLVAFGDQWTDAADPMRILAIYGLAFAIAFAAGTVYMATNRLPVLLGLISARLVILVTGLVIFVHLGITAAATCQEIAAGAVEVCGVWTASHLLAVRLRDLWRQIRPCITG